MLLLLMSFLLIKHFLADYVFQTEKHINAKSKYGSLWSLDHSFDHFLLTVFVVVPFTTSWQTVLLVGVIDFILHYHIDYAKVRLTELYGQNDKKFWMLFGGDQLLHGLTYVLIVSLVFNSV